jgi:AcrR family transcriptional regulator
VPPAFPGQARALVDASRDLGLEGVVLKRLSSTYQPGLSGDWLKIRHLAAPERHFPNRQALLDALAARGFVLLGQAIRQAIAIDGDRRQDQFTAAAKAYVGFALDNPALLELMFASKADQENEAIATAAEDVFALTAEVMGESPEDATAMTASPLRLVVAATLQGIANLAAAGRIQRGEIDRVIDLAVSVFIPVIAPRQPLVDRVQE